MKKFQIIINTHWQQFKLLKIRIRSLASLLKLKIDAKVTLAANLDTQDLLTNILKRNFSY